MKKFTKGLLTLTVLATMSLMAAEDPIIYVTTFEDEDGENTSKCSLREAITAASTHQPYGGCPKGDRYVSNVKKIQLEAGTYNLKRELTPNSPLYILGKEPADFSRPNAINNDYPAKTALKTTISGQGSTRLFNTINLQRPSLTLENIVLDGGLSADTGGALLLGGSTELNSVVIQNSKANKGGAIALDGANSHLTLTSSVIKANQAATGSALAMTCIDGLDYTSREIKITSSSFIQNGSATSDSVLAFCGQPQAVISSSTITQNTANSSTGNIIQFSSKKGTVNTNLSTSATLGLLSNTIVKNTAATTLLYDLVGKKTLNYNALAFNTGTSCKFNDGNIANVEEANIDVAMNALFLTSNDICELPKKVLADSKTNTVDLNGLSFGSLFSDLQQDKEFTNFLPMYFPRENTGALDLIDVGGGGACSTYEQRGIKRLIESTSSTNPNKNTCDIGSTEVLRLTIQNITELNKSATALLASYQENYDLFKELVENKETKPELLTYYTLRRDDFARLIQYTKSDQKYRTIFSDPFTLNLPDELVLNDGGRQVQHLNADNYDVSVKVQGVGKIGTDGTFIGQVDNRLQCSWNSNLKQILLYRTDDRFTADSDFEICEYTLTNKTTKKSAKGFILGRFSNIAPNLGDNLEFTMQHGTDQKISVDLLKGANDDGDGLVSTLTNPNKSPFFLNPQGQTQAIRIVDLPSPVSVKADRSGPCPNLDSKYTCYGGNVTMQLNNTLDVFSYNVKYVVYDADGAASAEGTVQLKNTATQPGSVRTSGGGGSMGWFSLFGILGLLIYRKRSQNK